jgi:hypothetical protein
MPRRQRQPARGVTITFRKDLAGSDEIMKKL